MTFKKFTPTQYQAICAAYTEGDAGKAAIESRRVKSRTISDLQAEALLYSKSIDGKVKLTPRGEDAFYLRGRTVTYFAKPTDAAHA